MTLSKFNDLLTVHRHISVQYQPTGCTIYFQFISVINLYMFRAGLLPIIRRYYSVCTAVGMCHMLMLTGCWPTASQHKRSKFHTEINTYIRYHRTKCNRHDEPVPRIYGEPFKRPVTILTEHAEKYGTCP